MERSTIGYSPHAWGWTVRRRLGLNVDTVFPTRVGMDRWLSRPSSLSIRIPHTRGDGPGSKKTPPPIYSYSPHAWGWTGNAQGRPRLYGVFPTRVGMDRDGSEFCHSDRSIPHTRGDGPPEEQLFPMLYAYSPHAWGWTVDVPRRPVRVIVFPTRVGMDRLRTGLRAVPSCIPHTRGDGPVLDFVRVVRLRYSPHAWGWTGLDCLMLKRLCVFPTRVGMDRVGRV